MSIYQINQSFVNKYSVFNLLSHNLFLLHADILFYVVSFMLLFVVFSVFKIAIITKDGTKKTL